MKRSIFVLAFLLAGSVFAQQPPEIQFKSVPDFIKLPEGMYFGEVSGVAVNSKGHVFIFNRGNTNGPAYAAAASQLLEFAADGKYIREIGHGLYAWSYAHTVRIDKEDNIWVTDKGSDMIIKFNPQGKVIMVFGRKQEASDEGTGPLKHPNPPLAAVDQMFRQVTDVAWDAAGDTFISDGYINSRVGKVDKNGVWIKSWGEPGTEKPGQFRTPHTIATDAQGNVYVGDRGNARIQVFDSDGNFLRMITAMNDIPVPADTLPAIGNKPNVGAGGYGAGTKTNAPGSPWAICITPGPNQVLFSADSYPGRVYKMTLDGKVLGYLGKSGKQLKEFGWIHEIACPSENEIIVAELLNWRAQKLILEPTSKEPQSLSKK
jgi:hypothetical protein